MVRLEDGAEAGTASIGSYGAAEIYWYAVPVPVCFTWLQTYRTWYEEEYRVSWLPQKYLAGLVNLKGRKSYRNNSRNCGHIFKIVFF
jgi:hypothetical protein